MITATRTLLVFLVKRNVKSWREHRRACIALLPAKEQKNAL